MKERKSSSVEVEFEAQDWWKYLPVENIDFNMVLGWETKVALIGSREDVSNSLAHCVFWS